MSATIQVRGWGAVVVAVIAAAGWLFWRVNMQSSLDTGAVEALKPWLKAEFARVAMKESGGKSVDEMSAEESEAYVKKVLSADKVEVAVLGAHGTGSKVVLKTEVSVDGKPPPDGSSLRYYRMKYSTITGWTYDRESDVIGYWLELF